MVANPKVEQVIAAASVEPEQQQIVRRLMREAKARLMLEERRRAIKLVYDDRLPVTERDVQRATAVEQADRQALAARGAQARSTAQAKDPTVSKPAKRALRSAASTAARAAMVKERQANEQAQRLEAERQERSATRWLEAAIAETMTMEAQRGDVVERQKSGAVRITTRDGLKRMLDGGGLSTRQYKAAHLYRPTYEACRQSLRSQLGRPEGGSAPASPAVGGVSQKLKAIMDRGEAEKAIHAAFLHLGHRTRQGFDAVLVVEQIAGEGYSVNALTTSARRRSYLSDLLRKALDALAGHYRLQTGQ